MLIIDWSSDVCSSNLLQRWFAWPTVIFSIVVPLLVAVCAWLLLRGLLDRKPTQPFLAALALFVLCFAGIGISFSPFLVPTSFTIWQAAGPDERLGFLLVCAPVLVPIFLAYPS